MKKRIKDAVVNFLSNNVLLVSFIVLSVLNDVLLRLICLGPSLFYKPVLFDLSIILLISSVSYYIKPKSRMGYYLFWLLFNAALATGNTIYYGFYKSFVSVNLLATASMVGQVNDSLFAKIHLYQFIYFIFPVLLIYINKKLIKLKYFDFVEETNSKKKLFRTLLAVVIMSLFAVVTMTSGEYRSFSRQWSKEYLVKHFGLYLYTCNDLVQSVQSRINTLFGYDEAANSFRNYYACKWKKDKQETNSYTNIFKDKNVLFIHAESIQNFLLNLEINNKEVTPTFNKLSSEGIYFSKFYPQISIGTSSDTEFTLTTGLLPSSNGTVFVNYYDREYKALPNYFNDMGYYTFSMHANDADYWNRKTMYDTLGYQHFYAKDSLVIPSEISDDYIGLGLSDSEFFKQIIPKLNIIKYNNNKYMGTIITLSNHSPFNEVEKYGEFDVTMDYSYVDENNNKVSDTASYLENTSMGNYIKSSHYADKALGELINRLDENKLLDNTILIIYGDHEARLQKSEFDLLYNYNPIEDKILNSDDEKYIDLDNYQFELLKNTPFIIWSKDDIVSTKVEDVMGMYDVLPTLANMFGFEEKYSLGNDIFSNNEKIVVFPNGNVLTNKVYYSSLNDNYIAINSDIIDSDYIERISSVGINMLEVSNGIINHNLIKNESSRIGECNE